MRWVKGLALFLFLLFAAAEEHPSAHAAEIIPVIPTQSEEYVFSIEADYIDYTGANQYTKASGNVVVIRSDVHLHTNTATINFDAKKLSVADDFIFSRGTQQIYGTDLDYDYQSNEARGNNIGMALMKNKIKGRAALIKEDMIIVNDAYQTTCPDENSPCNHITSKRMTIYPEWGNVVNDRAVVYFFFIPVAYVHNSVSDLNGDQDNMYASIPRPGYNPVEGNYLKFGWSFYRNEKLNGTLDLHYLSSLGFRSGFTNNYKLDQANRGQLRVHYLSGLGGRLSYGWQHRTLLGIPHKERSQIIDDFFRGVLPPSRNDYPEFIFDLINREMIDYQWVSYRPKLTLTLPAYELWNTGIRYSFSGYMANMLEENIAGLDSVGGVDFQDGNREYLQNSLEGSIHRDFDFQWGRLRPSLMYSDSTYFEKGHLSGMWSRLIYDINYTKSWSWLTLNAGYKYTPAETGISPFNSETFSAGTAEENHLGFNVRLLDNLKLKYTQYYSITNHAVRERIYGGEFKLHCWNVQVNWSEYYSQFTFGLTMQP